MDSVTLAVQKRERIKNRYTLPETVAATCAGAECCTMCPVPGM
jgi:hypothetical protein